MRKEEFAKHLGFEDYEDLLEKSEVFFEEPGDITWYVTELPDGRWAAWDDAELAIDRISIHATKGEAIAFQEAGKETAIGPQRKVREFGGYELWLKGDDYAAICATGAKPDYDEYSIPYLVSEWNRRTSDTLEDDFFQAI